VPIEITEIGWTTSTTSEADRAAMLAQLASELPRSDCGVTSLVPHTWVTNERDASNPEDWFGIFNADGTPKASGSSYLAAVRSMRGSAAATAPIHVCGGAGSATRADGRGSSGRARGPRLLLRVRRGRRHRRLVVAVVRCPSGCRVRLALRAGRTLARRSLRFSRRRRRIVLRARGKRRLVKLHVTARSGSGAVTKRVRTVRLRRR
jgi:hypothetical protein